jgi:hypothetical protein
MIQNLTVSSFSKQAQGGRKQGQGDEEKKGSRREEAGKEGQER